MARKRESPPRYLRIQIILSDQDADLKTWCANNKDEAGRIIRLALRDWLKRHHGDASAQEPTQQPKGASLPDWALAKSAPSETSETTADLVDWGKPSKPQDRPPQTAGSKTAKPPKPQPGQPADSSENAPAISEDDKDRLKSLLDQNSDFS